MNENWQSFIHENLLKDKFIDGVLLFSPNLDLVYEHGNLAALHTSEHKKFQELFANAHEAISREKQLAKGLYLTINNKDSDNDQPTKFVIRQLLSNSASCITKSNNLGLVLVKFSFGLLVASHSYPIPSHVAMNLLQDVVVLLSA